ERQPRAGELGFVVAHADRMPRRGRHQRDLDLVRANAQLVELAGRADRTPQPGEAASQDKDPLHVSPYLIFGVPGTCGALVVLSGVQRRKSRIASAISAACVSSAK